MLLTFQHPFTLGLYGPTGAGKTQLVHKIVTNGLIDKPIDKIWIFMMEDQPIYSNFGENVTIVKGPPTEKIYDGLLKEQNNLFIIDDMMDKVVKDSFLASLFTRGSHHRNLSIIFIAHNLFVSGKQARTIALNLHYLILMGSLPDLNQVALLGRRFFDNKSYFSDAYKQITQEPYGYLVIVNRPGTSKELRLRTDLFKEYQAVFLESQK